MEGGFCFSSPLTTHHSLLTVLNSLLPAFIRAEATREWIWGEHDCGLWLADWVSFATGIHDLGRFLRGRYASEAELIAIFGRAYCAKTFCPVFDAALPRTRDPLPGDIALLSVRDPAHKHTGAIRSRHGWLVMGDEKYGVSRVPDDAVKVLRAWRV